MAKQVIETKYIDEELGIEIKVLRTPKPRRRGPSTSVKVFHTIGETLDVSACKEHRIASLSMSKRANDKGN